ncbi:MAG: hypothetical protein HKL84_08080 [Acidimicrobiaceae bacterium]|nr:hypothetical protein [Acidimicrobiaceae bacterium]
MKRSKSCCEIGLLHVVSVALHVSMATIAPPAVGGGGIDAGLVCIPSPTTIHW